MKDVKIIITTLSGTKHEIIVTPEMASNISMDSPAVLSGALSLFMRKLGAQSYIHVTNTKIVPIHAIDSVEIVAGNEI